MPKIKEKNSNMIKRIIGIISLLIIVLWLFGIAMLALNEENIFFSNLVYYTSFLFTIPIFLGIVGGMFYLIMLLLRRLFKNTSFLLKICAWIILLSIIFITVGSIIYVRGNSDNRYYVVEKVKIVDIRDNKIIVNYTPLHQEDSQQVELAKPFLIKVQKGDYISVRYDANNPKKMTYILSDQVGSSLIMIGVLFIGSLFYFLMLYLFFSVIYHYIKLKKGKRKGKNEIKEKN